ncbi:unnamed protein product [Mytilus coruscus]|uniref:Uncharacterized protein n=1 Tax=Mytilus coruscus TaxID=42192 RepID=A0A6J8B1G9_MYTCO|nr:unnamed protein product [Mytilus coruscus]
MIVNTVGTIKQNPQTTLPQNVDSLKNIEHAIVTIEQDIHSLKDNSLNDSLHSIKNQLVTISDKFKEDNFNSPPRQLPTEAQQETYKYNVPTANRFEALQIDNSHEQSSQPSNRDKEDLEAPIKQVLMIGNSHFQRIQTPHLSFVDKCKVTKKATYDIKEATKVISDLQQEMQCVVIQSFSKDIHAETKVKYIDSLTSLFDNILAKWPKCKIIISTALFRGMSPSYNEKAYAANIEILHKFFQDPHIFVCDNSGLSSRGQPIHHFLARDNVHLSYAGKIYFLQICEIQSGIAYKFHTSLCAGPIISRKPTTMHGKTTIISRKPIIIRGETAIISRNLTIMHGKMTIIIKEITSTQIPQIMTGDIMNKEEFKITVILF